MYHGRSQFLSDPQKLQLCILVTLYGKYGGYLVLRKTRENKKFVSFQTFQNFSSRFFNVNVKLQQLKIRLNIFHWLSKLLRNIKNKGTPLYLSEIGNTKIFYFHDSPH